MKRGFEGAQASGAPPKRMRSAGDDDDGDNDFDDGDDDMDMFDDGGEDVEFEGEDGEAANHSFSTDVEEEVFLKHFSSWARRPLPAINPATDRLVFQQLEIDYYTANPIPGMPGPLNGPVPVVRMYGVTAAGNTVLAHVHGFMPYFYIPMGALPGFVPESCEQFRRFLNEKLGQRVAQKDRCAEYVLAVEVFMKESLQGYHSTKKSPFLRLTLLQPKFVPTCRALLEGGIELPGVGLRAIQTFESNLAYVLRFMVDRSVVGASWIDIPPDRYVVRSKNLLSHCQLEIDVAFDAFVSHAPEGEWARVAPVRILSFDIECAARKGHFPEAEHDPVIQIANLVTVQGENKPIIRNILTLNSCANIVGAQVLSFDREGDLLLAWKRFLIKTDPDVVIGYNIVNFDIPYLMNRAAHLKISQFPFLGRIKQTRSVIRDTKFSSKAYGTRENKSINLDGRVQFDVLQAIQRDYKLRSYSLNAVSANFLGEQKEDVHHSIIADLFRGSAQTRRRLATYCLKDAYLPQRLLDKLMLFINYMEMARVTGVPMGYLLTRGQQIRVISQLYRKCLTEDYVIPTNKFNGNGEQYEGATVIEPKRGYYDIPIATLDFASLYPSIMMAHNLCYTTLLTPTEKSKLAAEDYHKTPTNDFFVNPSVRRGLLPRILEDLLSARKRAKEDLKKAKDPVEKAVLDGRQLALKISANSVYGFTGAQVGQLPCLEISQSVTAYGRMMIEATQQAVEQKYRIENGYSHNATVIYGDTDSVMVRFGTTDVEETMKLGREAAQFVSGQFIKPIKLEFEKVYYPYLLINKKRYAGLLWTHSDKHDKMDAKGIETVRRDNCPLVKNVITTCLDYILIQRDVPGAIEYVKSVISSLLRNKIDLSELVISKALAKSGDDYDNKQAHAALAERMRERDPASAPAIGDRVPYVIIRGAKGAKAYEKSEDPIYVLENSIPLDTKYYLEQQLSKPLLRIFEPIMRDNAQSLLFGEHTRSISITTPTVGGIMKFAKKTLTCMGCKTPLGDNELTLCKHCRGKEAEIYQRALVSTNQMQQKYSDLWTQCQRCQGSLHQDVLCTNRDCPIFYMRKKVQKDLNDAQSLLDRFDAELSW
eukprot:TRINITY_DN6539_c0_g1_i1.p1 TRINITY_DN6539_c0_g1~~TRINITY_DN6539_c0_g1_i1.p1  ORF type:complete len:1108 (+),score=265.50 TRINITY_DN6539_c0_g1_i1:22-3324(+)